jgi:tRNA threonylcarbamoyladenosine biosynthesis protein TsaB
VSLILNIDTAVETASVALSQKDTILGIKTNPSPRDSAAWLHVAIRELMQEQTLEFARLSAVAVSSGPGSYTGLRVGMATAKGLCYALNLPFITINTLKMMASAAEAGPTDLLCPLIDARRMEVFTAVFDKSLTEVLSPTNLVLTGQSFDILLNDHSITFFGNGSPKFQTVMTHQNAVFQSIEANAGHMAALSAKKYSQQDFTVLSYSEPFYVKEFHSLIK